MMKLELRINNERLRVIAHISSERGKAFVIMLWCGMCRKNPLFHPKILGLGIVFDCNCVRRLFTFSVLYNKFKRRILDKKNHLSIRQLYISILFHLYVCFCLQTCIFVQQCMSILFSFGGKVDICVTSLLLCCLLYLNLLLKRICSIYFLMLIAQILQCNLFQDLKLLLHRRGVENLLISARTPVWSL